MNYYQEKIETDSIIPARIYSRKSKGDNCHYPLHWHNNLEFEHVLEGIIKGKINRKQIEVCVGEFLFANAEFKDLEKAVKSSMHLFKQDAKEVCKVKGINYPDSIAEQVISYFNKRMEEEDWE